MWCYVTGLVVSSVSKDYNPFVFKGGGVQEETTPYDSQVWTKIQIVFLTTSETLITVQM